MDNKGKTVMVAVPSGSSWSADTSMAMISMVAHTIAHGKGLQISVQNTKGSILPKSRGRLVDAALKKGCSHLLFIDSDMTFHKELLLDLLQWELPVIGANCATKSIPSHPTARKRKEGDRGGELVFTTPEKLEQNIPEEVWMLGCGVMLVEMSVFEKIERPFFPIGYCEEYDQYTGEDWGFCEKLHEAGVPIYVDHMVSLNVGHVGQHVYCQDDVILTHPEVREQYQQQFIDDIENHEEDAA